MNSLLNQLLSYLADEIDITDSQEGVIKRAYNSVSDWLNKNDSNISKYKIHIFPQGSMMYGTAVKPIEEDDYDIDLVCELKEYVQGKSPQFIKQIIGERLREHQIYKKLLKPEGRRCWTLKYSDELNFHLDILPAIPFLNEHQQNSYLNEAYISMGEKKKLGLLATDKNKISNIYSFIPTNPRGYAEWFRERMQISQINVQQRGVERVPEYPRKTVLQKSIQLLKRHRDVYFSDKDEDLKPISMIITTLVAKCYNKENEIYEFICNALSKMKNFIHKDESGNYKISNPVMSSENFADKWNERKDKANAFFEWLERAKKDFKELKELSSYVEFDSMLKTLFGQKPVDRLMNRYSYQLEQERAKLSNEVENHAMLVAYSGINHKITPPWNLPKGYRVKISGEVSYDGGKTFEKFKSEEMLKKDGILHFYAFHSMTGKYTIKWLITNTGYEARIKNGLRGNQIENSTLYKCGKLCGKLEHTEYTGTHYIQCFVIRNGNQCVAMSMPFVVNIK